MDSFSSKAPSRESTRSLTSSNWRVKETSHKSSQPQTWRPKAVAQQTLFPARRLKDDPQPYHPSTQRTQPHRKPLDHLDRPHDPAYPASTRLYVGNLLYSVQPHTLTHFFSSAGFANIDINMSIDPFTGRNPSFCFVDFESQEEAERALAELDGREIGGRPVKIGKGVPKRGRGGRGAGGSGGSGSNGVSRGGGNDGGDEGAVGKEYRVRNWHGGLQGKDGVLWREDDQPAPIFDRWGRTSEAPDHWFGQASIRKRLYVGGLPRIDNFTALEAEITNLFSGFKLEAISRLISPDPKRRSIPGNHYFVFVDMESSEEADRAVDKLLGTPTWWGGKLKVHRARPGSDSKRVLREQSSVGGGGERGEERWQDGEGKWDEERSWKGGESRVQGEKTWKGNWRGETEETQNGTMNGEAENGMILGRETKNRPREGILINLDD